MEQSLKEHGKTISRRATANKCGLIMRCTKASIAMERSMEKVDSNGRITLVTKVSSRITISLAMGSTSGATAESTKERYYSILYYSGRRIKWRERGSSHGLTDAGTKENTRMTRNKDSVPFTGRMDAFTRASG